MTKVFAVVLNFNRPKDTIACLKSIEKSDSKVKTVVVDNNSNDNSLEEIRNFIGEKKNFELLLSSENKGYSGGNNTGIKKSLSEGADYVIVINNDTEISRNTISTLVAVAESDERIGMISPKIYFAKGHEYKKGYKKSDLGKVIWYAGGKIDWANVYGSTKGVDQVDKGQFEESSETDYATGACVLITRKVLERAGMFDERYFLYYEDTELSQRVKDNGFKVWYSPRTHIWHKAGSTTGIGNELNDYFSTRNRLLFGMSFAPLRSKIALIKESVKLLFTGRPWQKVGIKDFYIGNFGKGSWK